MSNTPAILQQALRPFFLSAAIWAAVSMALWVAVLQGGAGPLTDFDPTSWHAHESLFGYVSAVLVGFALTAVPNWTKQPALTGRPLVLLLALWIAGRIAVGFSALLPGWIVAVIDLSCIAALTVVVTRQIVAGKNWGNLILPALLTVFLTSNAMFHIAQATGAYPASGAGFRLGLAATLGMIALIGGRIVPAFTRNWLKAQKVDADLAAPMQRFDKVTLLLLGASLVVWVIWPAATVTGVVLLATAVLQALRLARWGGRHTRTEPLLWTLHVAYAFLPLGAAALGLAILAPNVIDQAAAQHIWMIGTVGLMTVSVMARASLGHTGQALTAGAGTVCLILLMIAAAAFRALSGVLPDWGTQLQLIAGLCWILSFTGFALLYGPALLRPSAQAD